MKKYGWSWYVFGAQAVVAYGHPRMTADVDVTVALGGDSTAQLVNAMMSERFRLRVENFESFVAQTRVLPFFHEPSGMPVDMVLAGPGLEELFMGRARQLDLGGIEVPVISAEDLCVTKVLAGRPKDREDIVGILRERGSDLDLAQIRETLTTVEAALGQSDLSPAFEEIVARALRTKRPTHP